MPRAKHASYAKHASRAKSLEYKPRATRQVVPREWKPPFSNALSDSEALSDERSIVISRVSASCLLSIKSLVLFVRHGMAGSAIVVSQALNLSYLVFLGMALTRAELFRLTVFILVAAGIFMAFVVSLYALLNYLTHERIEIDANGRGTPQIMCVYPISGQYGLLNRILFYTLLLFATASCEWTWLSIGALAYVMNYSGATAIHAFLLMIAAKGAVLDLDAFGTWSILSAATLVCVPAFWLSRKIRNSAYSAVFVVWDILVCFGSVFGAMTYFIHHMPREDVCYSLPSRANSTMLTQAAQLDSPAFFNCTYACFGRQQLMRSQDDITAESPSTIFGRVGSGLTVLFYSAFFTAFFGWSSVVISCYITYTEKRQRPASETSLDEEDQTSVTTSEQRSTDPKDQKQARESRWDHERDMHHFFLYFPALTLVVALNEIYAQVKARLPTSEAAFEIGQWAAWVMVSLALVATCIHRWCYMKSGDNVIPFDGVEVQMSGKLKHEDASSSGEDICKAEVEAPEVCHQ